MEDELEYYRDRKDYWNNEALDLEDTLRRRDRYVDELQGRLYELERRLQEQQERSGWDFARLEQRYFESSADNDHLRRDRAWLSQKAFEGSISLAGMTEKLREEKERSARLTVVVGKQKAELEKAEAEVTRLKHIRGLVDVCEDAPVDDNEERPDSEVGEVADWDTRQVAFDAESIYNIHFPPVGADRLPATGAERVGGLSEKGAVAISRQAKKKHNSRRGDEP